MRKIITVLTLLPCMALASDKFLVGYVFQSNAAKSGTSISKRQFNNSIYSELMFNKNFYWISKLTLYPHESTGISHTLGFRDHAGYLRPYAEIGFDKYDNKLHYDIGSSLNFSKYVIPFVETDNFLSKDHQSVNFGASIKVYKGLYLKGSYQVVKQGNENKFSAGLYYLF